MSAVVDRALLDPAAAEALVARAREDGSTCQLALARDGRIALSVTLGDAIDDARFTIYSVTKALMAAAAWLTFGEGTLAPETRVADVIPGFGNNGKDAVRVEHLLTHTAGFPRAPMRPVEGADREARVARFRTWRLDWEPGSRTEYHPTSAHWVLAELIARATGTDHRAFLAERVTGPLDLPRLRLGVPHKEQADVVDVAIVGTMDEETARQLERLGIQGPTQGELAHQYLLRYNDPEVRAAGVPGAGAVGTAADVVTFFQALLSDPAGLWDPVVLADGTGTIRNRHEDPWTRVPALRTLGLVVAGDDGRSFLRGFGDGVGPRAFGATGVGGQVAWADPDSGLSFCYLTSAIDADPVRSFRRQADLSSLAAACVAG